MGAQRTNTVDALDADPASHGIRIGCSGYDYPAWRGIFYPDQLSRHDWFDYYASRFSSVEINNTFYSSPSQSMLKAWRQRAPEHFLYALKLHRYGSHMKHLKDPEQWLGRFVDRIEDLGPHLGPILVQLAPNWGADVSRLRAFLAEAPSRHRWAIEFRDPRWFCQQVYEVLEERNAALVLHDHLEQQPDRLTAGWVYVRRHGPDRDRPYHGSYSHQALTADARRAAAWARDGRDVFIFFNNDADGGAPRNARRLQRYVSNALESA